MGEPVPDVPSCCPLFHELVSYVETEEACSTLCRFGYILPYIWYLDCLLGLSGRCYMLPFRSGCTEVSGDGNWKCTGTYIYGSDTCCSRSPAAPSWVAVARGLLFKYNLCPMPGSKAERYLPNGDETVYLLANKKYSMRIQVKYRVTG